MNDMSKPSEVPSGSRFSGERFNEKEKVCSLRSLTVHFTSQDTRSGRERVFDLDVATNRMKYLQSSFG